MTALASRPNRDYGGASPIERRVLEAIEILKARGEHPGDRNLARYLDGVSPKTIGWAYTRLIARGLALPRNGQSRGRPAIPVAPCVRCDNPKGYQGSAKRRAERHDGERYGIAGMICRGCKLELERTIRREKSRVAAVASKESNIVVPAEITPNTVAVPAPQAETPPVIHRVSIFTPKSHLLADPEVIADIRSKPRKLAHGSYADAFRLSWTDALNAEREVSREQAEKLLCLRSSDADRESDAVAARECVAEHRKRWKRWEESGLVGKIELNSKGETL